MNVLLITADVHPDVAERLSALREPTRRSPYVYGSQAAATTSRTLPQRGTEVKMTRHQLMAAACLGACLATLGGCRRGEELTPPSPRPVATATADRALFAESVPLDQFPDWLRRYRQTRRWATHDQPRRLTREVLLDSLRLGRRFLVNNQKPAGNFNYQYDFVLKELDPGDSQVRQAGALWGVALIHQFEPDAKTRAALDKGLRFFFAHTQPGAAKGSLLIAYPGDRTCDTGTVALVALAIIEYLRERTPFVRAEQDGKAKLADGYRATLNEKLDGYLAHLVSMRLPSKHFSQACSLPRRRKLQNYSPYFDGEAMLCLTKAAKYLGRTELVPLIEDSAMTLARDYTAQQWRTNPDSAQTKGFFQWSCMAFWEYQDAGWENAGAFSDYVVGLAWWMIHTHGMLARARNTAYAYEGIIQAYRVAEAQRDAAALGELAATIDSGLSRLTSWQVGGPLQSRNGFLRHHPTTDPLAIGGIMNHRRGAPLRIDVTQHQMHAVILALKHVYGESALAPAGATKG
jgi:UDP-N-acetylmuramoyl-tripeptide--D-alanyl-D-alanine ligase